MTSDAPSDFARSIAVVIPTCDRFDLLLEAVASARAQGMPAAEIIVVDNGEAWVPEGLLPPGVQYHRLPAHVGPSRARNVGAAMAASRFIAFLDDDDLWAPDYLSEAMAALDQQHARCVFGRRDLMTEGGSSPYKMVTRASLTLDTLLRHNPGAAPSNMVVERELFLSIGGFDERLSLSEDRALAIDLLRSGAPIAFAPDAAALIRSHDGDQLSTRHRRKFRFLWKVRRLHSAGSFTAEAVRIVARMLAAPILRQLRVATGRTAAAAPGHRAHREAVAARSNLHPPAAQTAERA